MRKRSTPHDHPAARDALRAFLEFRAVVLRDPIRQTIRFLHGHNASMATVAALMELSGDGHRSVSELARGIGLSVAATSQLVDRLVQEGLVSRTESPDDRRRKRLSLTPAGQRLLSRMEGTYTAAAERALARVPVRALRELEAALAAVAAHVDDAG